MINDLLEKNSQRRSSLRAFPQRSLGRYKYAAANERMIRRALSHGLGRLRPDLLRAPAFNGKLQMALEGKVEGNLLSAVSEMFEFLAPCEPTQFPISESR